MKKEMMPLQVNIRLNDNGLQRLTFCSYADSGAYRIAQDMYTKDKVYETVALTKKYYEDGSNTPTYMMFDDKGIMRESAVEYWEKA